MGDEEWVMGTAKFIAFVVYSISKPALSALVMPTERFCFDSL
jgi:hypothetical protein